MREFEAFNYWNDPLWFERRFVTYLYRGFLLSILVKTDWVSADVWSFWLCEWLVRTETNWHPVYLIITWGILDVRRLMVADELEPNGQTFIL